MATCPAVSTSVVPRRQAPLVPRPGGEPRPARSVEARSPSEDRRAGRSPTPTPTMADTSTTKPNTVRSGSTSLGRFIPHTLGRAK